MNATSCHRKNAPALYVLIVLACTLIGPSWAIAGDELPSSLEADAPCLRALKVHHAPWMLPFQLSLHSPWINARTDPDWLQTLLGLKALPCTLSDAELERLKVKLQSIPVFSQASVTQVPAEDGTGRSDLEITLTEKWALLPIIRPTVAQSATTWALGAFDGHFLGRQWTLGGQAYLYVPQDASPALPSASGGVLWARAPRWLEGDHAFLIKLGREVRSRPLYQEGSLSPAGYLQPDMLELTAEVLAPFPFLAASHDGLKPWKLGLEGMARAGRPETLVWNPGTQDEAPPDFRLHTQAWRSVGLSPVLAYEALKPDATGLQLSGHRLVARAGALLEEGRPGLQLGVEGFAFYRPRPRLNLALHGVARLSSMDTLTAQTFLSELESIRGLPDGFLYGRHAVYSNLEGRVLLYSGRAVSVQALLYADAGAAAQTLEGLRKGFNLALGAGLRLASPRIYRMTLRLDVGWNPVREGDVSQAFSMTPFIDPYRHF